MSKNKIYSSYIEYFNFLIASIILVYLYQFYLIEIPVPIYDALRYIEYGINLKDHGVFGLNSKTEVLPGNENTPLFPFIIFVTTLFDVNLYESLSCLLENRNSKACELKLETFVWVQCIFIIITLSSIWLLTKSLTKSNLISWGAAIFAFLSGELIYFANRFLTESVLICLFSIFLLTLHLSFKTSKLYWHAITAIMLGLLTLTRPEYHYLFIFIFISHLIFCLLKNNKYLWRSLLIISIAYFSIVGSWQVRNYIHFEDAALTSKYGGTILAYRAAYNKMSWTEWGVAFIYWFPDCGDSISRKIFPKEYYNKLSFDEGSYFLTGSKELLNTVNLETDSPEQALSFLLKNEIFGNLFKHSIVTLPLFWRGIFISKYWGVIGLLGFVIILFQFNRKATNKELVLLSIPAWFIALLHAFVSVNVARYNVILIPIYSISIAIVIFTIYNHFFKHNSKSSL